MVFTRRRGMRYNRGRYPESAGGGGTPPYVPWVAEPGCVLWMAADDAGVATTSASVVDKDDFTTGNWTKTGVNVTPNSSGVYDLLTASATTATTQQVPSNHSTGTMTVTATVDVIRVADDWVCVELFATGRAWFNIATGSVGTVANVSATITPLGGGAFRLSVTSVFGANYVMLRSASADNTLTCTIGHSFLASNATIDQTRVSAFLNMVSAVSWAQASANLQPRYNPIGFSGRPGFEFRGQQDIISPEAAVVAALTDAHAFTLFLVVNATTPDAIAAHFAAGNSGFANSRTRWFGTTTDGAGRWATSFSNDASVVVSNADTADLSAGPHVVCWSSPGTTVGLRQDGSDRTLTAAAADPGTLTPNRVSVGSRPDSGPDLRGSFNLASAGLWGVELDSAAKGRVEAYLKAKWGTP
jgi:hypothetical protein